MSYSEFRIRVKDSSKLIALPTGEEGEVHLDDLVHETVEVMSRWLAEGKIARRDELVLLGSHLSRVLFHGKIHDRFMEAYSARRQSEQSLRVVLEFSPAAKDLAVWPWEYLYRPDDPGAEGKGFFIAVRNKLILSRHVPITLADEVWLDEGEVRILAVVSGPKGMTKVKAKPILDMLAALESDTAGKVQLKTLEQPTKRRFEEQLGKFRPHIVHFIGHGKYENGAGVLGFINNENQEVVWIKDQTIADCFEDWNPRLVFLQACEGARTDTYDAFSGVALQLAYNRVPAVIAMRYEVANRVAVAFAQKFYSALRAGYAIDEAVQKGRRELGVYLEEDRNFSSRAFGCPVVYLQSVNMEERGVIRFPGVHAQNILPDAEERPVPEPGRVYICPNPGCNTRINPDRKLCPNRDCRTEFLICGNPQCREAYMAASGFCDRCGWSQESQTQPGQTTAAPIERQAERVPAERLASGLALRQPSAPAAAPKGNVRKLWER